MSTIELGESIPALTPHATSVSLPTWNDNIGYEEGQQRVVSKMVTGYPRFFIHKLIAAFATDIVQAHGQIGQQAMLFPTVGCATRCSNFIISRNSSIDPSSIRVVELVLDVSKTVPEILFTVSPNISAVLFPEELFAHAKQYWQHSGDGISSRRAQFCHTIYQEGLLVAREAIQGNESQRLHKGPKRYQRTSTEVTPPTLPSKSRSQIGRPQKKGVSETQESSQFVEERFGRNLDVSFVNSARSAIRRRIAGSLLGETDLSSLPDQDTASNMRGVSGLSEDDVYLYPCGMNSIFHAHRMLMEVRGSFKSISFGFPYVDTLKILEKFGPGCLFYGNGSSDDLDDLEKRLMGGERYLALFCEFPGNPMLKCPDLRRIRRLADTYGFAVVVDETIGNFINVNVLPHADIIVSSLTKIFSGECNVMGGGTIFNPQSKLYHDLKKNAEKDFEDNYWAEDVMFMERNSRYFVSRIEKINETAEAICGVLKQHPLVTNVYYPKYNKTRSYYDACRTPNGGYGGLLSVTFQETAQAIAFYDRIETAKGPSLGTNFTLTSPYVILAHFLELDWAAQFGVPSDLVRISVGLEDVADLKCRVAAALKAAETAG